VHRLADCLTDVDTVISTSPIRCETHYPTGGGFCWRVEIQPDLDQISVHPYIKQNNIRKKLLREMFWVVGWMWLRRDTKLTNDTAAKKYIRDNVRLNNLNVCHYHYHWMMHINTILGSCGLEGEEAYVALTNLWSMPACDRQYKLALYITLTLSSRLNIYKLYACLYTAVSAYSINITSQGGQMLNWLSKV